MERATSPLSRVYAVAIVVPTEVAKKMRASRKVLRRLSRRAVRLARFALRGLFSRLVDSGVTSVWASRGLLWASAEYECKDAQAWLAALELVLVAQPERLLLHRRGAFYRAWCGGNIDLAMNYMDRYRTYQESLRKRFGLDSVRIVITRDIFTANYSTHAYLDTHLKAMALGWAPERSIVAPIKSDNRVWNPVMKGYWSRYVNTVELGESTPSALSDLEALFNQDLTIAAELHGRSIYIEHAKAQVQAEWERQGREPLLRFDEGDAAVCSNLMESLGLPAEAPFVTLHVRDNGSKTGSWNHSGTSDDYRNADVVTYLEGIELITQLGWYVVRVGDPAMKPLPQRERLIDYAHSQARTNLLDMYLFSQCRFFIGTSSGPILIPQIFGTPRLLSRSLA